MSRTTWWLVAACLLFSRVAAAQGPSPRLEIWGGVTVVAPTFDTTIGTSYSPIIERYSAPLAGTTAGQAIQLQGSRTPGLGGGLNLFFSEHVGFQFLADFDRVDVSGTNGDYSVLLNYTAMQPPDYVSKPYSYSHTFGACDASQAWGCVSPTTGRLRQTSVGGGLVGRWRLGRRADVEASGGVSYIDIRGDAQPLRYTAFQMGGHSTLMSEQYDVAYSIGPAHGAGVHFGVSLDMLLRPGIALVVDARYLAGADIAAPLVVTEVVNRDTIIFLEDPPTIQQALHPPDAPISPSRARLLIGLKVQAAGAMFKREWK